MTISSLPFETWQTIWRWNFSCLTIFNELVPWSVAILSTLKHLGAVLSVTTGIEKPNIIITNTKWSHTKTVTVLDLLVFVLTICTKHNKCKSSADWTWNTKMRHTHNHLGHEWISMVLWNLFFFSRIIPVDTAMIVKQLNAWMF